MATNAAAAAAPLDEHNAEQQQEQQAANEQAVKEQVKEEQVKEEQEEEEGKEEGKEERRQNAEFPAKAKDEEESAATTESSSKSSSKSSTTLLHDTGTSAVPSSSQTVSKAAAVDVVSARVLVSGHLKCSLLVNGPLVPAVVAAAAEVEKLQQQQQQQQQLDGAAATRPRSKTRTTPALASLAALAMSQAASTTSNTASAEDEGASQSQATEDQPLASSGNNAKSAAALLQSTEMTARHLLYGAMGVVLTPLAKPDQVRVYPVNRILAVEWASPVEQLFFEQPDRLTATPATEPVSTSEPLATAPAATASTTLSAPLDIPPNSAPSSSSNNNNNSNNSTSTSRFDYPFTVPKPSNMPPPSTETSLTLHLVDSTSHKRRWVKRTLLLSFESVAHATVVYEMLVAMLVTQAQRPTRLIAIVNPVGGRKQARMVMASVVQPLLELVQIPCQALETQAAGQAKDLAQGLDLNALSGILCVGGDGTVSDVVHGLLANPSWNPSRPTPVGLIPAGSTDTIMYSTIGCNDRVTAVLQVILGETLGMDVASVRQQGSVQRYALSFLGFGFYGDVIKRSESMRLFGPMRYDIAGFSAFLGMTSYSGKIHFLPASRAESASYVYHASSMPPSDVAHVDSFSMSTDGGLGVASDRGRSVSELSTAQVGNQSSLPELAIARTIPRTRSAGSVDDVNSDDFVLLDQDDLQAMDAPSAACLDEAASSAASAATPASSLTPFTTQQRARAESSASFAPALPSAAQAGSQHSAARNPKKKRGNTAISSPQTSSAMACTADCSVCAAPSAHAYFKRVGSGTEDGTAASPHILTPSPSVGLDSANLFPYTGAGSGWETVAGDFVCVNAANISCMCEKAPRGISPNAHLADGCVDLILIRKCSRFSYLRHLIRLGSGAHGGTTYFDASGPAPSLQASGVAAGSPSASSSSVSDTASSSLSSGSSNLATSASSILSSIRSAFGSLRVSRTSSSKLPEVAVTPDGELSASAPALNAADQGLSGSLTTAISETLPATCAPMPDTLLGDTSATSADGLLADAPSASSMPAFVSEAALSATVVDSARLVTTDAPAPARSSSSSSLISTAAKLPREALIHQRAVSASHLDLDFVSSVKVAEFIFEPDTSAPTSPQPPTADKTNIGESLEASAAAAAELRKKASKPTGCWNIDGELLDGRLPVHVKVHRKMILLFGQKLHL
ncbi:ceramide kinase [Capsaspora owczarzaki ATCC 30864]|uniref:Ceramide kinase n=1 Tax=Capsaspora owczarzaki (strain ATCC 30864) TaxID=595528 RepID=A0A0D2VQ08_CAPO3|nr:ceramide kinase [Capsaspora owczarzaki ATCC 30864]KJE92602.1 ceramide kinase [Capsaspora owczarzaki ATCC 30864]|eukprot:XP_004348433.1 ceramide kinase [Capsaspora owczarzaki ATCC 30864]